MNFKTFTLLLTLSFLVFANLANAQDKVDFETQIKPIFEKHCISCHGPEKEEAFRIDDHESTEYYIEESSDDSDLYLVLVSDDEDELMPPPEDGIPLSTEQIALIKTWIDQGGEWPEGLEFVDTSKEAAAGAPEVPGEVSTDEEKPADAKTDAKTQQIFNAIGSLHPAAVHLPIGLLLASGLFALLSLRGNFVMSDCAYYCLWLGTIGAIIACASGWWFSPMEKRGTVVAFADLFNQDHPVFWHRTGALVVTAVAFLLALFAAGARNRDPDDGMLWKLGLILLAGGIGWVGHTGGELHYPSDHYKDLNGLYNDLVNPDDGDAPKATEDAETEKPKVGDVSDENDI